ncbi:hypothetical protein [Nonomuraea sp. LPB2021202275-12-8]|uniref:hypothetical protein n=1 Tax=Nonomuraea sp. LPB2021202275-12-8 TaxID=3120159 RepID=UPI00300C20A4
MAIALGTGVGSPWQPWPGAIPVALVLGGLLFLRRRRPMTVLLLSIAVVFAYHLGAWSPAGWIWPLSVAYVTAAATPHVRWVAGIGAAQLAYSAVDAWWIVERNLARYLIHTIGEALLLALLITGGIAYAATRRWRARQPERPLTWVSNQRAISRQVGADLGNQPPVSSSACAAGCSTTGRPVASSGTYL